LHFVTLICGLIIYMISILFVVDFLNEPHIIITESIYIAHTLGIITLTISIITYIMKPDHSKSVKILIITILLGILVLLIAAYSIEAWQS
jgi:hypothetical protein